MTTAMRPIPRIPGPALTTDPKQVDAIDRVWFEEHPSEDSYIRAFIPGEFPMQDLPPLPEGFVYATLVRILGRAADGRPLARFRDLLAVTDDEEAMQNLMEDRK